MRVVQLTASTFFGGPERQMLELAASLPCRYRSAFLSFRENGLAGQFVEEAQRRGFEGRILRHDTPCFRAAVAELTTCLRRPRADVLCCHGYKADILGKAAARLAGIPVIAVSRGWTGESRKVRLYEALDRLAMRFMDRVVCVSGGQAAKVRRAGIRPGRVVVIANAIRTARFHRPDPAFRRVLDGFFSRPPHLIVGAAGRLSPEKGFKDLVEAAQRIFPRHPNVGIIVFGDGPLREPLRWQIQAAGLGGRFVLAGFRTDLDQLLPFLDVLVLPSLTEGLPNVVLEAMAAAVPVVATAVGGVPEVVEDGRTGFLVPPETTPLLADCLDRLLGSPKDRHDFGAAGKERVARHFTFEAQARAYHRLFEKLVRKPARLAV
jgi:glycosyltransferase involved in cell wall biosynthesis